MKQWSADVMDRDNHRCVVCGAKATFRIDKKTGLKKVFKSGNRLGQVLIVPLNSHHLLDKNLYPQHRTNVICGVTVCVKHHKYSRHSFHKGGCWAMEWLRINRPQQHKWVLENMGSVD